MEVLKVVTIFVIFVPMFGAVEVEKELNRVSVEMAQVRAENSQLKDIIVSLQNMMTDLQVCIV